MSLNSWFEILSVKFTNPLTHIALEGFLFYFTSVGMIKYPLLFFCFFLSFSLFAQNFDSHKLAGNGRVYGKIVDAKTKESIPSVLILKNDSLITGGLTKTNGEFSLEGLPFGRFSLNVKSIGYKTIQQNVIITPQTEEQDIGDLKMAVDETLLSEVEVTTEKSAVEMNIDRKVFNVDKNIVSRGGTAVDVMKNVPSVTIDENGNAQLRQNVATIYIDGRPTTLTLDQIAADRIERVEVITNPSAKYEASASGGIINIVMKSNNKIGYYGIASAGVGTNNHYNGMLSLNAKQKKIGFSVAYNYSTFKNPIAAYNYRTSLDNGAVTGYYDSDNNKVFKNTFNTGAAGLDYYINNRNTISFSENMVMGDFNTIENQDFKSRSSYYDSVLSYGNRLTNSTTHFENLTSKLTYNKTFPKKGRELSSSINYNILSVKSHNDFSTNTYSANGVAFSDNPGFENIEGTNKGHTYTFQADYVEPINDSTKLELGVRSNYKLNAVATDATYLNHYTNTDTIDPYLTNHYRVTDMVNGAYVNYSLKRKRMSYMLGLRFEQSYYKGELESTTSSFFQYSYPSTINNLMNALFPSIFISKKINDKQTMQFNVTRKIGRPDIRQLSPNISSSDRKNYSIGNPKLTPEFITTAEVNFNQFFSKGNVLFSLFYRNTQSPLTNFIYKYPADSSILVSTTINGKQNNTLGMDNTFKYNIIKGLEATLNMNLFYTVIDASYNNSNFSNKGFYYNSKLRFSYRLPKGFAAQVSGNYESPKIIPQGKEKQVYFVDCGLSKELYKIMTLTFSVSDMFNTKGKGNYLITDQYIQNYWSRRETRYVKFTALINFGKPDTKLFKKRQQTQQNEGGGDVGF
jgi:outer membrane receptor protein involved in Fe transport